MERALQKLARQLNQYDTASLSSLWGIYANLVSRFEPTRRWEEAVLIFSMIQAVHWKNQLFNLGLRQSAKEMEQADITSKKELLTQLKILADNVDKETSSKKEPFLNRQDEKQTNSVGGVKQKKRCKVLFFPIRHSDKP
jgi:hypothetical protein